MTSRTLTSYVMVLTQIIACFLANQIDIHAEN